LTGRALAVEAGRDAGSFVVGVPETYPWDGLSHNASDAVAQGTRALQLAGIDVRPLALPAWAGSAFEAHAVIQGYEAWRCLGWEWAEHSGLLSPQLRDYLEGTRPISAQAYAAAQTLAARARAEVPAWLHGFDALLTPSAPDEAPPGLDSTGPSTFNRLWTLLGLPCISVPGAMGDYGAPMGLQLIGGLGDDARLLALAQRLETALGKPQGQALP
jgi:Asp-tRNA(Asn)/Glu-tRNA(Gln) amidotransferase A subunit family amidase